METQIAQMEALLDHSKPGDKAATFELFSLGVATNQQLESAFGNAESTRSTASQIQTQAWVNSARYTTT